MGHVDAYFICATPRTGSTLLCELLRSTAVAGLPESYFRVEDLQRWAKTLGVEGPPVDYWAFLQAAIAAGRTSNGIFAARVMWGTFDDLLPRLVELYQAADTDDVRLLIRAFGRTRFVLLEREDDVAQAVSWTRAEQTQYWHPGDGGRTDVKPHYDFTHIHAWLRTIRRHNAAWRVWFAEHSIEPLTISYEELIADPASTVDQVLEFVGVAGRWNGQIHHDAERQADNINADWIARYHSDVRAT